MNPGAKLDIIMELYRVGIFCKCGKTHQVYNIFTNDYESEIAHEANCEARIKMMELLRGDENDQV